ncbi:maltose/moltooligosaccharide transporter [Pustulibacterium marinum]|uniref:Maltose/moltooligosaccharide transporter n=1 Tax=Pustulibacterium marinum TaxID=1224947 RepID=A0A1I7EZ60_9FLAO|nr:MFS transporter [Pustulibacterium marinum]SFU29195.1 maltose/moltooligosaccharide transporter [Pustulibacterium marinum]
MKKRLLSFWEIWNMSFGFLGIQFGYALQGGFMSRIFQTLGASEDDIPLLWIAAPLTGLIVQPIIGYLSDRTWHPKLGRRKPYFLIGAILSSLALFFAPHSSALWMAAGFLWVIDACINISMEPFRALVADKLHESQRSYGFVVQTLIIGIGTWIASNLPWAVNKLGISNVAPAGVVPPSVRIAFAIGAFVFILSILYTIFTTEEYPPEDMEAFLKEKKEKKSNFIKDITANVGNMPKTMKKLGLIQFFSWFAFFTMWSLAMPALTEHIYQAPKPNIKEFAQLDTSGAVVFTGTGEEKQVVFSNTEKEREYTVQDEAYNTAADEVGSAMGIYGLSSMAFALLLTFYSARFKLNRKYTHLVSLIIGGAGFIGMYFASDFSSLAFCFVLIGIAWGSILSMPYAMLSSSIDPNKMGMFMGLFNMFIVIPQIVAALGGVNFVYKLLGDETINAMIVAGISLILAGLSNLLITNKKAIAYSIDQA